jgi:hypothetical protein
MTAAIFGLIGVVVEAAFSSLLSYQIQKRLDERCMRSVLERPPGSVSSSASIRSATGSPVALPNTYLALASQ